jgi:hypothetical protein
MNKIVGKTDMVLIFEKDSKPLPIKRVKITDNMKIIIPSQELKRRVLIRKINKYLKENFKNSKIVNKLEDANTIAVLDNTLGFTNKWCKSAAGNQWIVKNSNREYKWSSQSYVTDASLEEYPCLNMSTYYYYDKDRFNEKVLQEHYETGAWSFIDFDELIKMSKNQYIKDQEDIDFNPEKLKVSLTSLETCKLIYAATRDADLTEYMEDIIEAYYETSNNECRKIIRDKILRHYDEKNHLVSFNNNYYNQKHNYYIRTMKSLGREPKKEFVLDLVGFYK